MKFTLKTLQRDTFEVEMDDGLTVADLKKRIEEEKGAGYAAANLKLIYAGTYYTLVRIQCVLFAKLASGGGTRASTGDG